MNMEARLEQLRQRREQVEAGGGLEKLDRHRAQGKLTARERVQGLLDPGSFQEVGAFARHRSQQFEMASKELACDGVVTGAGTVDGRLIHLASQDFTVAGGSAGEIHCQKIANIMRESLTTGSPFVFINDSGGARVQEGIDSLSGYGKVFFSNVELSGSVPQISLICGPCAGGAAYSPALTDFVIQTRKAQMFITGPEVIRQVTHETIGAEELGGADAHMGFSGVSHFIADDDEQALWICRKLLSFLPSNNLEDPPLLANTEPVEPNPELRNWLPHDAKQGYDVRELIGKLVDHQDFLEVQAGYAPNLVIGFARIAGRSVGLVANQPGYLAGVLDINASVKASRFVRFCNAFNLPLVTLVDVPGFLPGVAQEHQGIIRHGAKLLFAYSAATVSKITVILRKAYGGAYLAMCAKDLGADRVLAWPTAEVAVMGAEGAAEIIFRREIQQAKEPAEKRRELIETYREAFSNPYVAAGRGLVDEVIDPAETRLHLARSLEYLSNKRLLRPGKKHGLIPL